MYTTEIVPRDFFFPLTSVCVLCNILIVVRYILNFNLVTSCHNIFSTHIITFNTE